MGKGGKLIKAKKYANYEIKNPNILNIANLASLSPQRSSSLIYRRQLLRVKYYNYKRNFLT